MVLPLSFPYRHKNGNGNKKTLRSKEEDTMSKGTITQENYQTLKKEGTDRKSDRLSIYEKRFRALALRKGRREKKV